jgi:mRNA interferase YafQ
MRTIERSSAFKRDVKRVKSTPRHARDVNSLVSACVDLLLIYRKPDVSTLRLARLGSHSQLFG